MQPNSVLVGILLRFVYVLAYHRPDDFAPSFSCITPAYVDFCNPSYRIIVTLFKPRIIVLALDYPRFREQCVCSSSHMSFNIIYRYSGLAIIVQAYAPSRKGSGRPSEWRHLAKILTYD
jgi:hypothetical protein